MSFHIIMKGQAKRELIRSVAEAWIQKDPAGARQIAQFLQEITKQDLHKTGKTKRDTGYISMRVPRELWLTLRFFIPDFGDDQKDIDILSAEFPDLVLNRKSKRPAK